MNQKNDVKIWVIVAWSVFLGKNLDVQSLVSTLKTVIYEVSKIKLNKKKLPHTVSF